MLWLGALGCALCAMALSAPSMAGAASSYALDPTLSLTGDCTTTPTDPVPDPGACPGAPGVDHPSARFDHPCGVAVDLHGNLYVTSRGHMPGKGRIDVFDSSGGFILQIDGTGFPCRPAVDSGCNIYVNGGGGQAMVYSPDSCPPTETTTYGAPTEVGPEIGSVTGLAVDPSNDHLYLLVVGAFGFNFVEEYDSLADGSGFIRAIELAPKGIACGQDIAVWGDNHDVYLTGCPRDVEEPVGGEENLVPRVFVLDGASGEVKQTLTGAGTPTKGFSFTFGKAGIAVDQDDGQYHVSDFEGNMFVARFASPGIVDPGEEAAEKYLGCIGNNDSCKPVFKAFVETSPYGDVAIDNSGGENHGYVYVASGTLTTTSHLWAFAPLAGPEAPDVCCTSVSQITDTEALLEGEVNPHGEPTTYRFEYTKESDFLVSGFTNATIVPASEGDAGGGGFFSLVSEGVDGLAPGTAYRFRLVATNHCDPLDPEVRCETVGEDARFSTYPSPLDGLPDGRAYELVTPPETNGRIPTAALFGWQNGNGFPFSLSSSDGARLIFGTEGGSLPGTPGSGLYETYEAFRGEGGWSTRFTGPHSQQATSPRAGGVSPDHDYSFLYTEFNDEGTLGPPESNYLRHPDGSFESIGIGSLGEDPRATGRLITAGATHVIFVTGEGTKPSLQLEPNAPPAGTDAIYDRSPGGPTHVVSLLPGEVPLSAGDNALYQGVSSDGTAVAFKVGPDSVPEAARPLFVRLDNSETVEVTDGESVFGGLSANGDHLVYLRPNPTEPTLEATGIPQGDIFLFDTASGQTIAVGSGEESVLVNVAADGSRLYFVSPAQLDGSEGEAGADNLYVWESGTVRFIATLAHADVIGQELTGFRANGLGLWATDAVGAQSKYKGPANNPSRSTPDGDVLVFESSADLTSYESDGHRQIYRYDATTGEVLCLSCNPTGLPASSDASLQTPPGVLLAPFPPLNAITPFPNVTANGRMALFQSSEALVPGDVDGRMDVYEWQAEGSAGCATEGGCLHLISSGQSGGDDYLYAATADGSSIFFQSGDMLVPRDADATPSIYVARIGGGFAEPGPGEPCQGEACQPPPVSQLSLPNAASTGFQGPSRARSDRRRRCPKGKRKIRRAGKMRCVRVKKGSARKGRAQGDTRKRALQ